MEQTETISLKRIVGKNEGYYYYCKYDSSASERITKERYESLVRQGEGKHTERQVDEKGYVTSMVYTRKVKAVNNEEVVLGYTPATGSICPLCKGTSIADRRVVSIVMGICMILLGLIIAIFAGFIGLLLIIGGIITIVVKYKQRYICLSCKYKFNLL